jgi:hypothetical protein
MIAPAFRGAVNPSGGGVTWWLGSQVCGTKVRDRETDGMTLNRAMARWGLAPVTLYKPSSVPISCEFAKAKVILTITPSCSMIR